VICFGLIGLFFKELIVKFLLLFFKRFDIGHHLSLGIFKIRVFLFYS